MEKFYWSFHDHVVAFFMKKGFVVIGMYHEMPNEIESASVLQFIGNWL